MRELLLALALTSMLGGCFVVTHPAHSRSQGVARRDCPPAHHWDGNSCVHNGEAKGLKKHGR